MPVPTSLSIRHNKVKQHKAQSLYIVTRDNGGDRLYYSYLTPIAVFQDGKLFLTNKWYSVTTTKHMSTVRKLEGYPTDTISVEQAVIDYQTNE